MRSGECLLPRLGDEKVATFVIDFPDSKGFIREELISIEGSLGGFVFRTGKQWAGNAFDLLQSGLKMSRPLPRVSNRLCPAPD